MRQIPPMIVREAYFAAIEAEIKRLFDDVIYRPLTAAMNLPMKELTNASSVLADAIRKGDIWYEAGRFHGQFNARISRELKKLGARFHYLSRTWALPTSLLPAELIFAQAAAASAAEEMRRRMIRTLDDMNILTIDVRSRTDTEYAHTITWMEGDFQKAVAGIAIPPKLTDAQRRIIADQWGDNLDKYIKDWAAENILKLREQVQGFALPGGRAETLAKIVQENYGVSRNKAKFLARQETALLMSKFQETRYRGMGITRYRWSGALDKRERPDHRRLQGKVFSWDDPPITVQRTGARNNPGEDYNCRCVAVPLLD